MDKKKVISLSLAGALMLGNVVFAANVDANDGLITAIPISAPILAQEISGKVDLAIFKEIKTEDKLVSYNVQIPKVQGLKDLAYQERINKIILDKALKDIDEVETQAKELAITAEKEGWEYRQHEIFIDFVLKANDGTLSFVVNTYMYTGGANGITRVDCYNIDMENNAELKLKDLFKVGVDYQTLINNEILAQIKEREEKEEAFFFTGENGFTTISEMQDFYLQDGNPVILFQKYEIAPGAMGTPEFKIPLASLGLINQVPEIIVNGQKIEASEVYINKEGTVMVPLRAICNALKIGVQWNDENRSVLLGNGISLTEGKDSYRKKKDAEINLGTAPEIKENRLFVPLSFFKKVVGMNNAYVFEAQIVIDNNETIE